MSKKHRNFTDVLQCYYIGNATVSPEQMLESNEEHLGTAKGTIHIQTTGARRVSTARRFGGVIKADICDALNNRLGRAPVRIPAAHR
jgi:hypothetical protein